MLQSCPTRDLQIAKIYKGVPKLAFWGCSQIHKCNFFRSNLDLFQANLEVFQSLNIFLWGSAPQDPHLGWGWGRGLRVLPPDPPALLGMLRLLIACFACRFNQFYLLLGSCLLIFISFFDFVTLLYHGTLFCIMALILSTVSLLLELVDSFQCIYTMSQ